MLTIQEFIAARNINIDALYVDEFWNSLNCATGPDAGWLYLSDRRIEMIGFEGDNARTNIHGILSGKRQSTANFVENEDYKVVSGEHPLVCLAGLPSNAICFCPATLQGKMGADPIVRREVQPVCMRYHATKTENRGGHNRKHYIVTTDCFKKLLLKANTKYSDRVYDYYIALERLFWQYSQYQAEYRAVQAAAVVVAREKAKDKELAVERAKNMQITNFMANVKTLAKNETLYIATTVAYASFNRFKIGKCGGSTREKLEKRMAVYNTGRAKGDEMYYVYLFECNNARLLENRLKGMLMPWCDAANKEMYILHYSILLDIIEFAADNYDKETDYLNSVIKAKYADSVSLPPMLLPPMLLALEYGEPAPIVMPELPPQSVAVPVVVAEPVVLPVVVPDPALVPVVEAPPQAADDLTQVGFTFCIKGWSAAQTKEFIEKVLLEYKLQTDANKRHKPSWTGLEKLLRLKLAPHTRQPNLKVGRADIIHLCTLNGVALR